MMAVPSASPLGIGPAGTLRKRSSSCACVIFNKSGTVIAMASQDKLESLQVLDEGVLIRVGEIGAEVMAAVFNEIRTIIHLP